MPPTYLGWLKTNYDVEAAWNQFIIDTYFKAEMIAGFLPIAGTCIEAADCIESGEKSCWIGVGISAGSDVATVLTLGAAYGSRVSSAVIRSPTIISSSNALKLGERLDYTVAAVEGGYATYLLAHKGDVAGAIGHYVGAGLPLGALYIDRQAKRAIAVRSLDGQATKVNPPDLDCSSASCRNKRTNQPAKDVVCEECGVKALLELIDVDETIEGAVRANTEQVRAVVARYLASDNPSAEIIAELRNSPTWSRVFDQFNEAEDIATIRISEDRIAYWKQEHIAQIGLSDEDATLAAIDRVINESIAATKGISPMAMPSHKIIFGKLEIETPDGIKAIADLPDSHPYKQMYKLTETQINIEELGHMASFLEAHKNGAKRGRKIKDSAGGVHYIMQTDETEDFRKWFECLTDEEMNGVLKSAGRNGSNKANVAADLPEVDTIVLMESLELPVSFTFKNRSYEARSLFLEWRKMGRPAPSVKVD